MQKFFGILIASLVLTGVAEAQQVSNEQFKTRMHELEVHCGKSQDLRATEEWARTAQEKRFRRNIKSCDEVRTRFHNFAERNAQRYAGRQQAAFVGQRPPQGPGDKMLDSLGPNGQVKNKIKSISALPPEVRRCIVNTIGARGVPGVAVSQKCLKEKW